MNISQYEELRNRLFENGENINSFIDVDVDNKVEYLDEATISGALASGIGGFLSAIGLGKLGGTKLKSWGVKQNQADALVKKAKKFRKDVYGKIQSSIRPYIEKRNSIMGEDSIDDLKPADISSIKKLETKIFETVEDTINRLYKLKTSEIYKKIESLNITSSTQYALKYVWESQIVGIKVQMFIELIENRIILSKAVKQKIKEEVKEEKEDIKDLFRDVEKEFEKDIEEEPEREEGESEGKTGLTNVKKGEKLRYVGKKGEFTVVVIGKTDDNKVILKRLDNNKKFFVPKETLKQRASRIKEEPTKTKTGRHEELLPEE